MKKMPACIISLTFVCVTCSVLTTGQAHERHKQAVEDSGKITSVSGGVSFQEQLPYDKAYDNVLTFLKRKGESIDSASKETGQITTAMTIKGGWHQTGTRTQITVIKDSDTAATIRVAVTEQKRYKGLQTEPWGDPKVDQKKSAEVAEEVKTAAATPGS